MHSPSLAQLRAMGRLIAGEQLTWRLLPDGSAFCAASFGNLIMDVDGKLRQWHAELSREMWAGADEAQRTYQQS